MSGHAVNCQRLKMRDAEEIYKEVEFNIEIIELPEKYNARCLDGSPYKFTIVKGYDEGINKFLIYFEGGGYCGSEIRPTTIIESCRKRALGNKGKSTSFIYEFTISRFMRLMSKKKKYNPTFYNWNKITIKYCDGMGHLSNLDKLDYFLEG